MNSRIDIAQLVQMSLNSQLEAEAPDEDFEVGNLEVLFECVVPVHLRHLYLLVHSLEEELEEVEEDEGEESESFALLNERTGVVSSLFFLSMEQYFPGILDSVDFKLSSDWTITCYRPRAN